MNDIKITYLDNGRKIFHIEIPDNISDDELKKLINVYIESKSVNKDEDENEYLGYR